MKYGRLTLRVISHTCQYGLGDSVDHSGDEGVSLIVPVVGLAEVSDFLFSVEFTQQDGEQVLVDDNKDLCNQHFTAESEHLPDGRKINAEAGLPVGKVPVECRAYDDKGHCLYSQTPIGKSVCGKNNPHNTG